jgi:hypothetical protein
VIEPGTDAYRFRNDRLDDLLELARTKPEERVAVALEVLRRREAKAQRLASKRARDTGRGAS